MATLDIRGTVVGETALAIKAPCLVATTGANITLSDVQTIDGVTVGNHSERVLVKDQTNATQNGIYIARTGPWILAADFTSNNNVALGTLVLVTSGTANAALLFEQTCTDNPIVIGTSLIAFVALPNAAAQIATSSSEIAVGTGSATFTVPTGKSFAFNQWVLIQETSNSANQMLGQVTSYSGSSLAVDVIATAGSGTHSDWTIVLTNSAAAAGYQPPVGSGNVTGPGSAISGHVATFNGTTGKIIADGGALGGLAALSSLTAQYLAASAISLGATMLNGTIVASVAANALTLTINTFAGNTPSASDPVLFVFRSATAGAGNYYIVTVTSSLSLTIPSGSAVGFSNGTPGRLWLAAVDSGGTVSLAVINSLAVGNSGASPSIYSLAGWWLVNVTAIGGGAANAQTFYGANSLSSVPFSVLGHVTWEAGNTLATAGSWSAAPSVVELFRPGVMLPGRTMQVAGTSAAPATSTTSGSYVTMGLSQALSLTSTANCVKVSLYGWTTDTGVYASYAIQRGTTGIGETATVEQVTTGDSAFAIGPILDYPVGNASWTSGLTYALYGKSSNNSTITFEAGGILVEEIMA